MLTREERNVVVFVALGLLLGSLPGRGLDSGRNGEEDAAGPEPAADGLAAVETDLFPIDLNAAGPELLAELPGIGPAKAQAIVETRRALGGFRTVDQLEEVRGIGPRTVEKLRELVRIGTPADAGLAGARERGRLVGTTGEPAAGEPDPGSHAAGSGPEAAEVER